MESIQVIELPKSERLFRLLQHIYAPGAESSRVAALGVLRRIFDLEDEERRVFSSALSTVDKHKGVSPTTRSDCLHNNLVLLGPGDRLYIPSLPPLTDEYLSAHEWRCIPGSPGELEDGWAIENTHRGLRLERQGAYLVVQLVGDTIAKDTNDDTYLLGGVQVHADDVDLSTASPDHFWAIAPAGRKTPEFILVRDGDVVVTVYFSPMTGRWAWDGLGGLLTYRKALDAAEAAYTQRHDDAAMAEEGVPIARHEIGDTGWFLCAEGRGPESDPFEVTGQAFIVKQGDAEGARGGDVPPRHVLDVLDGKALPTWGVATAEWSVGGWNMRVIRWPSASPTTTAGDTKAREQSIAAWPSGYQSGKTSTADH